MKETIKTFHQLTCDELFEIYKLRTSVFVVEQNCPYQEVDDADKAAYHLYLNDDDGKLLAYCRMLPPADGAHEALIGRVIAVKRRCGLGSKVVSLAMDAARTLPGVERLRVEAQSYAAPMYEKLGFRAVSGEYLEDGILHISMICE